MTFGGNATMLLRIGGHDVKVAYDGNAGIASIDADVHSGNSVSPCSPAM